MMQNKTEHRHCGRRRRRRARFGVPLALALSLLVASCGSNSQSSVGREGPSIQIVATTSIWGDVVSNIVGDAALVEVLLPLGADPHDYQASAADAVTLRSADLVVINGLALEDGLGDVLDAAASDGARIVALGEFLDPHPFAGDDHDHSADDEALDPHVWLDPLRVADAALLVGSLLAELDPSVDWESRAQAYADTLIQVDRELAEVLGAVPPDARELVTNHDALGYFADRYGFTVVGTVIPGGSTLADPSSAALAELVDIIRAEGVPAIFAESIEPAALAEAIADEAGGEVAVVELFTGSLGGPGSGAETLIDMLRENARLISEALS